MMRKWFQMIGAALAGFLATGAMAQGDSVFTAGGPGGLNERGGAVQRIQAQIVPDRLMPGGKTLLKVTVTVSKGFHINANKPGDESMIPTELTFEKLKSPGVTIGKPIYPNAKTVSLSYSPKPLKVYEEVAVITVPITLDTKMIQPGTVALKGKLRYQGCNAKVCLPPATAEINASFIVNGRK